MKRRVTQILTLTVGVCAVATTAFADLASYIARPEPQYHWEKSSETQEGFIRRPERIVEAQLLEVVLPVAASVHEAQPRGHIRRLNRPNGKGRPRVGHRAWSVQAAVLKPPPV